MEVFGIGGCVLDKQISPCMLQQDFAFESTSIGKLEFSSGKVKSLTRWMSSA